MTAGKNFTGDSRSGRSASIPTVELWTFSICISRVIVENLKIQALGVFLCETAIGCFVLILVPYRDSAYGDLFCSALSVLIFSVCP